MTAPNHRDHGVFQPVLIDGGDRRNDRPVTVIEPGKPRLIDAATPGLREALADVLVVARAGSLILLTLAGLATALLVLCRIWGWLA
jgi:hypothetical protein